MRREIQRVTYCCILNVSQLRFSWLIRENFLVTVSVNILENHCIIPS